MDIENYKDRGRKKWTAMMLPEHISMLKEMNIDYEKESKPILDEYQLQEINEKIGTTVEFHMPLIFELWIDGFDEVFRGVINKEIDFYV